MLEDIRSHMRNKDVELFTSRSEGDLIVGYTVKIEGRTYGDAIGWNLEYDPKEIAYTLDSHIDATKEAIKDGEDLQVWKGVAL